MERDHPCNLSLDRLAEACKDGVFSRPGGYPLEFGTISVSDGISMGHEGMPLLARLPRGDRGQRRNRDAGRTPRRIGPARRMRQVAARDAHGGRASESRERLPVCGSILPGIAKLSDGTEKEVTIIDAFEAVGACSRGLMSREDVDAIERAICPERGRAAGCTRQHDGVAAEALGMSLPGSAAPRPPTGGATAMPGAAGRRGRDAAPRHHHVGHPHQGGVRERDRRRHGVRGSTNAVLHLLAIAHEAEVSLTLATSPASARVSRISRTSSRSGGTS